MAYSKDPNAIRAKKVKVKKKLLTANSAADPKIASKIKANAVPQTAIGSAIQIKPTPLISATSVAEENMRREMSQEQDPAAANIYDERIGGYGLANPGESGEAAVRRILKAKVKRKK